MASEFVVGSVEEDHFLDLLAEFMWENRDELEEFTNKKGN